MVAINTTRVVGAFASVALFAGTSALALRATCPSSCRPPENIICTSEQIADCTGTPKACTCVDAVSGK